MLSLTKLPKNYAVVFSSDRKSVAVIADWNGQPCLWRNSGKAEPTREMILEGAAKIGFRRVTKGPRSGSWARA
jgi:hypothetical protein